MKRLGRWVFNGLAAISMLLCVAILALWVCSYWKAIGLGYRHQQTAGEMMNVEGKLILWRWITTDPLLMPRVMRPGLSVETASPNNSRTYRLPTPAAGENGGRPYNYDYQCSLDPLFNYVRYQFSGQSKNHVNRIQSFLIPDWLMIIATAILPGIYFLKRSLLLRGRGRKRDSCPARGFDIHVG